MVKMEDWEVRQKIYHMVYRGTDMGDDLSKETIIEEFDEDMIVRRALEYPLIQTKELYYPGKSYAVACVFASLLAHHFGKDIIYYLNKENLLYENDPYFQTYDKSQQIYDRILSHLDILSSMKLNEVSPNCLKTIEYFYKEFLLDDTTKHLAPN